MKALIHVDLEHLTIETFSSRQLYFGVFS